MRRISHIKVDNFKSLVGFQVDLAKFVCLIGMNGSGKSTVLQAVDFISEVLRGNVEGWLKERKWRPAQLKSKLRRQENIELCVGFSDEQEPAGQWQATYDPGQNRCTTERIDLPDVVLETTKDTVEIILRSGGPSKSYEITCSYQGSILSALREDLLAPSILECKRLFEGIKSLDLLAPEYLRQRTRESAGTLGRGGQNLSAFLYEMSDRHRQDLVHRLKKAYPQLEGLHAKPLRSGWKQLEIIESYEGQNSGFFPAMTTEARHVNDGMLRLIAILAELESDYRFLLFDEIENGINPELVEFVLDALTSASQQIMVTTHSPLILNYLDDEVARSGVIYLYKTAAGHTRAIPFFSIPSLAEKLKVMGPGEAFVDTNLTALAEEIAQVTEER